MFTWRKSRQATATAGDSGPDRHQAARLNGARAEDQALAYLQEQGLRLVERNYRVARGPSRRGGEIDLILRACDGTLVFVEVRARASRSQGGAAASVTPAKRARLVLAARHYLLSLSPLPPCRFDVVAVEGEQIDWLPAAFDAG